MPIYSHSRLNVFENCPRQFFFRYVAKLETDEEEGIEGFLGTLVHDALEKLYRDMMFGRVLSCDDLVGHFDQQWQRKYHDGIVIVRAEFTAEDYRQVGEDCLRKYHARYAPFDLEGTLALEERVTVKLDKKGRYRLQGYVDRLAQTPDGVVQIHDYKTNARLPSQAEKDADRQLGLYQMAIMERWPAVKNVVLVWHFLRFDTEIRSTRTRSDLNDLRRETIALITDIESRHDEDDFPTRESPLCEWCAYQSLCPCCKHQVAVEALPANRFLMEPGVTLVNRLSAMKVKKSDLKGQIAVLDKEVEEVEEALVQYAATERVEKIVGSEHEARISTQTQVILPRKGQEPEDHAAMDHKLRASKVWPAVSVVDVHALRRIWVGDEDDPGRVRAMLKPFVHEDTITKIGFRKRKDGDAED